MHPKVTFPKLISSYFVNYCSRKQTSFLNSVQTAWVINLQQTVFFLKPLTWLKLIFTATEMWQIATFAIFQKVLFRTFYSIKNLTLKTGLRAAFIKIINVIFQKQEHFWNFHAFLKNRKQKKFFQITTHNIIETIVIF